MRTASILVVDDDPNTRRLLRTVLERRGYEIAEAEDGSACLVRLAEHPRDLILMDVMMPGLDGIETASRIRADGIDTPIVFMSARGDDALAADTEAVSHSHRLGKPFALATLVAVVEAALEA